MAAAGAVSCNAIVAVTFAQLLSFTAEYDALLPQDTELAQKTNIPDVFGATSDDTSGLRIVSLLEASTKL